MQSMTDTTGVFWLSDTVHLVPSSFGLYQGMTLLSSPVITAPCFCPASLTVCNGMAASIHALSCYE